jgi:hypothetical protein
MDSGRVILLAALAAGTLGGALGAGRQAPSSQDAWGRTSNQITPEQLRPVSLEFQLKKVDQGFADVGPLSMSLRQVTLDLRTPDGFRDVYQIPRESRSPYAGWFARIQGNGGLVAVFPESEYVAVKKGVQPQVPLNTRYVIGGLDLVEFVPRAPENLLSLRLDGKVDTLSPQPVPETKAPTGDYSREMPPEEIQQQARQREAELVDRVKRMFEDQVFRAERVGQLLSR